MSYVWNIGSFSLNIGRKLQEKNNFPQADSIPQPPAYETDALSIRPPVQLKFWLFLNSQFYT